MLIFIEIVKSREGWGPKLNRGVGFSLIVSHAGERHFGIYEVSEYSHEIKRKALTIFSPRLAGLIESAKRFPPILALAKKKAEKEDRSDFTESQYLEMFQNVILATIEENKEKDFRFCQSLVGEVGYRSSGEYYWIIDIDPNTERASWVDDNFEIYTDNIDTVELTLEVSET